MSQWRSLLSSVRVRLTLWNVGVLALVLGTLGFLLHHQVEANLTHVVDEELSRRAHFFEERMHRSMRRRAEEAAASRRTRNTSELETREVNRPPRWLPISETDDPRRPRFLDTDGRGYFTKEPIVPLDTTAYRQVLQGGSAVFTIVPAPPSVSAAGSAAVSTSEGSLLRVRTTPVRDPIDPKGPVEAVVQVAEPLDLTFRELEGLTRTLLALVPLALLVAGISGAFLTQRALLPVRAVARAAAEIQAEDLSARLEVKGADEFTELSKTFNAMLARLDGAFRRLERAYEQQRRFVADASHELKTPLTVIKANTSLALGGGELPPAEYRETLEAVDRAVDRTNRIVHDLFLLARSDGGQLPLERKQLNVLTVLDAVAREARLLLPQGARVSLHDIPDTLTICADPHLLHQMLINLTENALRHTPPEGSVTLSASQNETTVFIRVTDTGEGIAPEHLPLVTERFYRVDDARERTTVHGGGTGLGLAICRAIAEAHQGTLTLQSEVGQGTTAEVSLPR
ncbi:MAG: ATP-binding protein [Armatimonadota bacterium]